MDIYLVRHGETNFNKNSIYQGSENDCNDLMKVYQNIEISKTNENLDKVEIIGAVQNIIKNSETRLSVVNAMDNFMKTDIKKQNIKKRNRLNMINNSMLI